MAKRDLYWIYPPGFSVNHSEACSKKYTKVDDAARFILTLGRGTLMAKLDIAQAYRNIPVHADDQHLLGMIWNSQLFIDTVLRLDLDSLLKSILRNGWSTTSYCKYPH